MSKIIINRCSLERDPWLLSRALKTIHEDIEFLRGTYPKFDSWLINKVVPGISNSERTIVIETRSDIVASMMILKHDGLEKKICTLRVRPDFEGSGIGIRNFKYAFDLLENEKPLLSISEKTFHKFNKVIGYFSFEKEAEYFEMYGKNSTEYSFNGILK